MVKPAIQPALFPQVIRVASAYSQFGFKLFAEVAKCDAGKNVFLSPHSVATVLSMVYLGAAGETRQALAKALHVKKLEPEVIEQVNRELHRTFSEVGPTVELILGNAIWVRIGLEFKSNFLEQARECFEAEIRGVDFSDPATVSSINQWAATKTRGKISHIVDQLDPQLFVALMNALYFKGQWAKPFDPAETKERPFHLSDGTVKRVPMMSRSGSYSYCEGTGFQAVELPYEDHRFSLYLFLPKQGRGVDAFLQGLNVAAWNTWRQQFQELEGEVVLPRFRCEYGTELKYILTAMGLGIAFDPKRADFQGIRAERDVFISKVVQKAFVEVNEEGTEAVAVTVLLEDGLSLLWGVPPKPFRFIADRPFFFAIRDSQSRVVLFMGVVNDPS